jgi:ubiquitin-protein ligase E3 C
MLTKFRTEFGVSKTVDLIPNGRETPVTKDNRYRYIALVSHYRLNAQIRAQSAAFVAGLQEVIDPRWLRVFNQSELRLLVGGAESPIDLDDRALTRSHILSDASRSAYSQVQHCLWSRYGRKL